MESLKIAAAYVRVSTEDQTEYSPDSQIKAIRDHAARDGYIVPEDLVFQDDAISGKRADRRPQFMLLIARAKEPDANFDRIYVWEFSRFARNQEESLVYKNLLRKRGITVQSIKEPLADSPFASLIERIIEWMDEYYLINLATEVKRGLNEKASRGEPIGSAPYGYSYSSSEKRYLVNEEEAALVRYIFQEYASGRSLSGLTRELNEKGIKTRNGNPIERRWIHYLLDNPVYIGKLRWSPDGRANYTRPDADLSRVQIINGSHDSIIPTSQFETVQKRLKENAEPHHSANRGDDYMLRGLIKCSACGSTLSRTHYRPERGTPGLQCVSYAAGKCTVSHHITIPAAEEAIISYLQRIIETDEYTYTPTADRKSELAPSWDRMIAAERRRIERAREAYLDGTFSLEEYTAAKSDSESNIAKLESALANKKPEDDPRPSPSAMRKKVLRVLRLLKSPKIDQTAKNEALHSIIDHIVYVKPERRFDVFFHP